MPVSLIEILDRQIKIDQEDNYSGHEKTSFWASESELMAFEIYHRFMKTPLTNPISEEKLMMLKMRKLTEEAVVSSIRPSGQIVEEFTNSERAYFKWGEHNIPISGYPDLGMIIDDEKIIIEIKTYYGGQQHSQIRVGHVKTNYLKQLAIYLYHFKIKHGILLMINQGTGERFEFDLYQDENNPYHFICPDNEIEIDLLAVFKRWEKIWIENVLPHKEPAIEFQYKYDIEKIDWNEISTSAIRKARNNQAVIGDWQVKYSDYKDLIIERQNTTAGYTPEEIARIIELTQGYTTRSSKTVRFDPDNL